MIQNVLPIVRAITILFCNCFPGAARAVLLKAMFGYSVHGTSKIGISFIDISRLVLGPDARIGHFNILRRVYRLEIGASSGIGNFNWISGEAGAPNRADVSGNIRPDIMTIGEHSFITSRHIVDVAGGVDIGNFSTVAGYRSQILTHSINIHSGRQELSGISIGSFTFVGTACVVLKGSHLPDFCALAAHSTLVPGVPNEPYQLLRGNPAVPVKTLDPESVYFSRSEGRVT